MRGIYLQLVFYLALLLLWQGMVDGLDVPEYLVPSPSDVIVTFSEKLGLFLENAGVTLFETLAGFAIGVSIAFGIALGIVRSRILETFVQPLLIFSQTTPRIAIAPLLVIWFGYDLLPKIIIVIIICFFPVVVNTVKGLKSADQDLLDLMRSYGASSRDVLLKVRIPSGAPYTFAALKVAITLSVVGAVVGEFVGSDKGLGHLIIQGNVNLDTSMIFVSIILLGLMGMILYKTVELIERRMLHWTEE